MGVNSGKSAEAERKKAAAEAIKQDLQDAIAAISAPKIEPHAFCEGWFANSFEALGLCPRRLQRQSLEGASDISFVDVSEVPHLMKGTSCVPPVVITSTPTATIQVAKKAKKITETITPTMTTTITGAGHTVTTTVPLTRTKYSTTTLTEVKTEQPVVYITQTWEKTIKMTSTSYTTEVLPFPTQDSICRSACYHADKHAEALAEIPRAIVERDVNVHWGSAILALAIVGFVSWLVFIPVFANLFDLFDQFVDWCQGRNPLRQSESGKRSGRSRDEAEGRPGADGGDDDPHYDPDDCKGSKDRGNDKPDIDQEFTDEEFTQLLEKCRKLADISGKSTPTRSRENSQSSDPRQGDNKKTGLGDKGNNDLKPDAGPVQPTVEPTRDDALTQTGSSHTENTNFIPDNNLDIERTVEEVLTRHGLSSRDIETPPADPKVLSDIRHPPGSSKAPSGTPRSVSSNSHITSNLAGEPAHPTEAEKHKEGLRLFQELYPNSYIPVTTSGSGLFCGLRAMIISLTALQKQDPTIIVPTLQALQDIVNKDEVYKGIMDETADPHNQNTSFFGVDQLVNIIALYYWLVHGRRVEMGVEQSKSYHVNPRYGVHRLDFSREKDFDNLFAGTEQKPIQFFIHYNGFNHFSGIAPPGRWSYCAKKFSGGKVPEDPGYNGESDEEEVS